MSGFFGGGGGTSYPVAPSGGTYTTAASGTASVALGDAASAAAGNSVALGNTAAIDATSTSSVAIGYDAEIATGCVLSVVIGRGSTAGAIAGQQQTIVGASSSTLGERTTAIGAGTSAVSGGTAVGNGAIASATTPFASTEANATVAIGRSASVVANRSIAIGKSSSVGDGTHTDAQILGAGLSSTRSDQCAVAGSLNARRYVSAQTSSPVSVTGSAAHTRTCFTNEGAAGEVNFNLPTAVAGLDYSFVGQAAQNLRITAAADDTIRMYNVVSAAAGNILAPAASAQGSTVRLVCINATEWIAEYFTGPWTVT
jgi:hypothetical protein